MELDTCFYEVKFLHTFLLHVFTVLEINHVIIKKQNTFNFSLETFLYSNEICISISLKIKQIRVYLTFSVFLSLSHPIYRNFACFHFELLQEKAKNA